MTTFRDKITEAYAEMITHALPADDPRFGVERIQHASGAFCDLAGTYVDEVERFVGDMPTVIVAAKRLGRLGDSTRKALEEYQKGEGADATEKKIDDVVKKHIDRAEADPRPRD